MPNVYFEGMILQASLILALGPQNLFVLESGLKRHHHLTISFVCFLCDLFLIMLGVAGAATFFTRFPEIKIIVGILGIGFLIFYGVGKLKYSDQHDLKLEQNEKQTCFKAAILSSVLFSVVNPHAYLDGIVLIGGYSAKYSDLTKRLTLGLGAASFSLIWFLILSMGASFLVPLFKSGRKVRIMMASTGVILLLMSAKLSFDVYGWVSELYPDPLASLWSPEGYMARKK
jgi:L-lysine exporter family protein LysE/ArgO